MVAQGAALDRARAAGPGAAVVEGAALGEVLGRVVVERLGISSVILEGVDAGSLDRAVGHVPGTALPGSPGNVALAAHRDTYFRPLREARPGDVIRIETASRVAEYRVDSTFVTSPRDVAVLGPRDGSLLTLITCYPFGWIGPAPSRFIVPASAVTGAP